MPPTVKNFKLQLSSGRKHLDASVQYICCLYDPYFCRVFAGLLPTLSSLVVAVLVRVPVNLIYKAVVVWTALLNL